MKEEEKNHGFSSLSQTVYASSGDVYEIESTISKSY